MKNLLKSTLILMAGIIIFPNPSWAEKDCPTIPNGTKILTVKSKDATLRTEADSNSTKGPGINPNDELTVVPHSPKKGPDQKGNTLCWYQVKRSQNDTASYWIAEVGFNEFSSFKLPQTSPSPQSQSNASAPSTNPQNQSQTTSPKASTPSWLLPTLVGISVFSLGAFIFSLLTFLEQKRKISILTKNIHKIENSINQSYQQLFTKIPLENNRQLDSYYQRAKTKFQGISEQISELKRLNFSQGQSVETSPNFPIPPNFNNSPPGSANYYSNSPNTPQTYEPIKREIDETIYQFNQQNRDYFNDSRFQPLNLTKISSQGTIGEDGRRIIQLEPINDVNQSLFLQILADGENWLIPNIISPYIRTIMNNLEEYSEIFTIRSGTGRLTLIQPAKLKNTGSGFWEIDIPGEFQQ